jgi:hypothetical protein
MVLIVLRGERVDNHIYKKQKNISGTEELEIQHCQRRFAELTRTKPRRKS